MKKKMRRLKRICAAGMAIATAGITVPAAMGTLPVESVFAAGDVAINATNFPDAVFRKYVSENYDSNKDGKLSQKECDAVKEMYLHEEPEEIRSNITSFKGIENFTELTLFRIYDTEKLSELDTSKNTKLKTLHVWNNSSDSNIKKIDVGKSVVSLDLWMSNVENLDISKCTELESFIVKSLKNLNMRENQEVILAFNHAGEKIQVTIDNPNIVELSDSKAPQGIPNDFILKGKNPGTTKVKVTLDGNAFQEFNVTVISTVKNGWVSEDGGMKYYKDGVAYTGWHWMTGVENEKTPHWSYFGKDGKIYTGWKQMSKNEGENVTHWSYFGDNGWLRTGWQEMGKGTGNPDGNAAKHWSYFGGDGWLRTGWQEMGKGTGNPDGNAVKHWSYFGDNGWLRTGWQQMGKGTTNPDGNAAKHWSYFGPNGWLRTGWQQMGKGTSNPDGNTAKHWSYFGDNGWLRTGLQSMGRGTSNPDGYSPKHLSYFGNNGWLVTNRRFSVAGRTYTADGRGWAR